MEDAIRRRRRLRHLQEQRRKAAIRRRNALMVAALASAVIGAMVGSGAGGDGGDAATKPVKLARGGVGGPPDTARLVPFKGPVPILMYHVIDSAPPGAALSQLYVDPDTFDSQMEWLRSDGFRAVSLNQVYDAWFRDGKLPEKPVVVSFDDGYRSQYVYARPELRKLGWPGVLSLIAGRLDQPDSELTPAMVRRLIDAGWELDSHTIHHVDVSNLDGAALRDEIAGSRRMLSRRFHQPVNFFCYPSGRYDAESMAAVRAAGYLGATTTDEGLASKDEMFRLKRIRVDGSDGVSGLKRKLAPAGA